MNTYTTWIELDCIHDYNEAEVCFEYDRAPDGAVVITAAERVANETNCLDAIYPDVLEKVRAELRREGQP